MVISTSPIINNCIGVILPSKAPIDINTDAAAISAPIKFPSDNLQRKLKMLNLLELIPINSPWTQCHSIN